MCERLTAIDQQSGWPWRLEKISLAAAPKLSHDLHILQVNGKLRIAVIPGNKNQSTSHCSDLSHQGMPVKHFTNRHFLLQFPPPATTVLLHEQPHLHVDVVHGAIKAYKAAHAILHLPYGVLGRLEQAYRETEHGEFHRERVKQYHKIVLAFPEDNPRRMHRLAPARPPHVFHPRVEAPLSSTGVVLRGAHPPAMALHGHHAERRRAVVAAPVQQAVGNVGVREGVVLWAADGDAPAGHRVVDGDGSTSAEEQAAVAAVPELPAGILAVPDADEREVAPEYRGAEVGVGADGRGGVEHGEAGAPVGDEQAEERRRGVAGAESAEEVGAGGDGEPALGG